MSQASPVKQISENVPSVPGSPERVGHPAGCGLRRFVVVTRFKRDNR